MLSYCLYHTNVWHEKIVPQGHSSSLNIAINDISEFYKPSNPCVKFQVTLSLCPPSFSCLTISVLATLQPRVPAPRRRHFVLTTLSRSREGTSLHLISFRFRSTDDSASLWTVNWEWRPSLSSNLLNHIHNELI